MKSMISKTAPQRKLLLFWALDYETLRGQRENFMLASVSLWLKGFYRLVATMNAFWVLNLPRCALREFKGVRMSGAPVRLTYMQSLLLHHEQPGLWERCPILIAALFVAWSMLSGGWCCCENRVEEYSISWASLCLLSKSVPLSHCLAFSIPPQLYWGTTLTTASVVHYIVNNKIINN